MKYNRSILTHTKQKGNHFSLLGGSVKKELEKSAQALDEANMDLERKIQENEQLHDELKERQFEFTDSINSLLKQIQDLEKRVQELSDENANLLSESKVTAVNGSSGSINEEAKLLKELEALKTKLKEKEALVEEKDQQLQENDQHLLLEIQSLRAILLAQVGNLQEDTTLYDIVPEASDALKQLEDQAREYFSNSNDTNVNALSSEIAEKLVVSTSTYSQELSKLVKKLEDTNKELNDLILEREQAAQNENKSQSELQIQLQEKQKKYQELTHQHDEKSKQFDAHLKQHEETVKKHEEKLKHHEENSKQFEEKQKAVEEKMSSQEKAFEEKIKAKSLEITDLLLTIETNQKNELKKVADLQDINHKFEKENAKLQQEIEQQVSSGLYKAEQMEY